MRISTTRPRLAGKAFTLWDSSRLSFKQGGGCTHVKETAAIKFQDWGYGSLSAPLPVFSLDLGWRSDKTCGVHMSGGGRTLEAVGPQQNSLQVVFRKFDTYSHDAWLAEAPGILQYIPYHNTVAFIFFSIIGYNPQRVPVTLIRLGLRTTKLRMIGK